MVIRGLSDLAHQREVAVIINVGTKNVSTLALLSVIRFARIPALLIDCESADGSLEWFSKLERRYDFNLLSAPKRPHGKTLDWVFGRMPAERVLLVDSDVELLSAEMLTQMRLMLDETPNAYGSGFLHPSGWLPRHYGTDLPIAPGIGYYMARPWIPFTLLRVEAIRLALSGGGSFKDRLVNNDILPFARFRYAFFRTRRLGMLDVFRRPFDGQKPAYVFYDTGAAIHEFLAREKRLEFQSVSAGLVPWSVRHLEGITRGTVSPGSTDTGNLADAHSSVARRLREAYGLNIRP